MKKMNIYIMEYYLVIKDEILKLANGTRKKIRLCEVTQNCKHEYDIDLLICGFYLLSQ